MWRNPHTFLTVLKLTYKNVLLNTANIPQLLFIEIEINHLYNGKIMGSLKFRLQTPLTFKDQVKNPKKLYLAC